METFRKRFLYPFCRIGVFRTLGLSVFDFGSGIGFLMLLLKRGNEMMVFGTPDVWMMEFETNQFRTSG
ncbi:uncharacterized protein OCT59_020287 [Rhizophagus irregularis]|uniref:uncharacterized protein n=1 Tax=Rhizophagus irregularis TaxID=588596 RepID=UPI00331F86F8|nr:hypothetical protein OCT59_020287 [Rhizophagus irregularis]